MGLTKVVRRILANYQSDNPGVQGKLAQILLQGRLGGTGKMIVLPVDQSIEHGPARSEAARRFGIHRSTVRKMLTFSVPPGYRRTKPPSRPKLEAFTSQGQLPDHHL